MLGKSVVYNSRRTLVVWKLDRLGRNVKDLVHLITALQDRGVQFHPLTNVIDTSSPAGRFFFHAMASLAQMEREFLIERTRAGLEAAKIQGRRGGPKPVVTPSKPEAATRFLQAGAKHKDVAQNLRVFLPTLYRWVPAAAQLCKNTDLSDHLTDLILRFLSSPRHSC